MDSDWIGDLLQQYITQTQNLQEELCTGHEQQDQNGTNQHGSGTTNSAIPAEISRVAVWLLLLWAKRPAVWFAQAEVQLTLAGISSEQTKFCYVSLQLDQCYAAEVEDIITSPTERDPYATLKTEPVTYLPLSREQRIHQFLTHEMGDCKPSQFLRQLRSLVPDVPDNFLCSIWSSWLPSNIQTIIAGQSEGDLNVTARCADRIIEVSSQPILASVVPLPDSSALQQCIEDLCCQVAALSAQLAHLHSSSRDLCCSSRKQCLGNTSPS
jgi:hypothetical protein